MQTTRSSSATRGGLTPARIVALLLITAVAAGLLILGLAAGDDAVSVPKDARAGQLDLKSCTYQDLRADCGTLVVPENRRDPQSRLIALPITRIRARSARSSEPIFRLEGGPGLTNMKFDEAARFADDHDVVLVGYRGVDGSSVLDCPEVTAAMKKPRDLLGSAYRRDARAGFSNCASRLRAGGTDLAGYTLPQRVDDLEAARKAMRYGQVDLLSESAGTRTARIYSERYPTSIHRSVMIAVNPPGRFLWDGATTDRQIRRYAQLCSKSPACRSRTGDLASAMRKHASDIPDRWGFLPIREGNVRLGSFFGMMESTAKAGPLTAPRTIDTWLSSADGDASGMWLLSFMTNVLFPEGQTWGDVAAASRADASAAKRYFGAGGDQGSILANAGTEFLFAGGDLMDAWPSNADDDAYSRVRDSDTETLLVGGSLDFATPPVNATKQVLPHLRNGHQVVLSELGHTTDFWSYEPAASTRLISRFLDSGRVDRSAYRPAVVDFSASGKQTSMAKVVVIVMVGLPLLALLLLALVVRRVLRRGRLGRVGGAAVRGLLAPVLGLTGWLFALVVVLATSLTVPIDDELLVLVSVALPVATGVYWGWVDRGASRRTRVTGLGAAITGAVIGAWLGFAAAESLIALFTAIAGASAAANLALLVLDISSETRRSAKPAAPSHERPATYAMAG